MPSKRYLGSEPVVDVLNLIVTVYLYLYLSVLSVSMKEVLPKSQNAISLIDVLYCDMPKTTVTLSFEQVSGPQLL